MTLTILANVMVGAGNAEMSWEMRIDVRRKPQFVPDLGLCNPPGEPRMVVDGKQKVYIVVEIHVRLP